MLDLYICSQRLCYHDVPIHFYASRRGWPRYWTKHVVLMYNVYTIISYTCLHLMILATIPKYCLLGWDAVYHCLLFYYYYYYYYSYLRTVSCHFVHCITELNNHFRFQFILNSATHRINPSTIELILFIKLFIIRTPYSYYTPYYSL